VPLCYAVVIWWKGSLNLLDAAILIGIYAAYLVVLGKMPPEEAEGIEDLELIPRTIVKARPRVRIGAIVGLFVGGGLLIYFTAEPFLGSLLAISAVLGVPAFVFVQWVAPFVSEFPEKVSAFYWARTVQKAPMALMNMVSSNINQWTLLAAMLPIVYAISRGEPAAIVFDQHQELELLMTIAQSGVGMLFLMNMELAWWEATTLFSLWGLQFALSPIRPGPTFWGYVGTHIHWWVTVAYLVWIALGMGRMLLGQRQLNAFPLFAQMWRRHVRPAKAPAVK
jgi:cation:H+ antiporter